MANFVTVKVEGAAELERKLYDLPTKFAKKYIRDAMRKAVGIWKDEIKTTAPRRTGWLQSQIAFTTRVSGETSGSANVGVRKKQDPARVANGKATPSAANEAYWAELGTVHQPARPFIRPAFESKAQAVLDKFTDVLRDGMRDIFGSD